VKRRRRLRRLIADEELLRRRAAGEPLRQLADDYDVAHTTLGRYFGRPEVKEQLKKMGKKLRAEQRQLAARRAAERRLERHVRRKADEQAAAEAEQARRYRADLASWNSRGRASGSGLAAWLDERDAPRLPPTRADRHSTYDKEAERTVTAGGGIQTLLAATELPTLEAAADSIDSEILVQAFDNDALERAQPQLLAATLRPRLRRLVPDTQLLRRRAAGEPLRMRASDYAVAHTTLARFFARPEIEQQLRQTVQESRAERRARPRTLSRMRQPEPTWPLRQPPKRRRTASASRRRN
jgi:hypothetical protein